MKDIFEMRYKKGQKNERKNILEIREVIYCTSVLLFNVMFF